MAINVEQYKEIKALLNGNNITLVAVSKIKTAKDIMDLYNLGQRDFGENYVQELVDKETQLPKDIRWHYIGHLQSNKVKYIAPFVHLIHGVDSYKLLKEIDKQAAKFGRPLNCLLQVHIAQEETKFGMDASELMDAQKQFEASRVSDSKILGLMGMASFSNDENKVRNEFKQLKKLFDKGDWSVLSMGMSGDYKMAIEEGSTMVRIGSLLFGSR